MLAVSERKLAFFWKELQPNGGTAAPASVRRLAAPSIAIDGGMANRGSLI